MRENGCQCECPTRRKRKEVVSGGKRVTVEDVEDEYDKLGGVLVRRECIESAGESDGPGGVKVGGGCIDSAEESDVSGGVIVGDGCIESVEDEETERFKEENDTPIEVAEIEIRTGDDIQFKGETIEANYLLEFLWMIRKTSHEGRVSSGEPCTMSHQLTQSTPAGYRWTNGQSKGSVTIETDTAEVNAAEVSIGTAREEEKAYGNRIGFPTQRRPADYHRNLETVSQDEGWGAVYENMIGDFPMTLLQRDFVRQLLYTWRDLFHTDPETMPVTDLVMHTIPTYDHVKPIRSKDRLYSPKEIQWQRENIPRLLKAGVISYCDSPWSAQTKHPVKKDGSLRMVNIFCPINAATIKSNYPMKRVEPIVNLLSQDKYKKGPKFQADATNGYYAIPLWQEHTYKTAFSCNLGQFCYNVMGQGLTGAPHTYSRMKDIAMGTIPEPNEEDALHGDQQVDDGYVGFEYFMDDDYGVASSFNALFSFLHEKYFPRINWARLTLKPSKTRFFCINIELLGYELQPAGLRPSVDKIAKIRDYPTPRNEEELDKFLYMTTYLRRYIPGRADHAQRMKQAVIYDENPGSKEVERDPDNKEGGKGQIGNNKRGKGGRKGMERVKGNGQKEGGKKTQAKVKIGWQWGREQENSFQQVKRSIIEKATTGGDVNKQYHLSCDASQIGLGAVLFQLAQSPPGTILTSKLWGEVQVVMFISQRLSTAERNYLNTEREALAVLRALEESRWLIVGSPYPVKVYTDHSALIAILNGRGSHQGRITSWMMRLSEYQVEYHHVRGTENGLADGLSRMRTDIMEPPKSRGEWEDVATIEEVMVEGNESMKRWIEEWANDEWYRHVIEYHLTGTLKVQDAKLRRMIKRTVHRYSVLNLDNGEKKKLLFRELTGEQSTCVKEKDVPRILHRYHDSHGHFARDMTLRMLRGKYYWPTRVRDVALYCKSCDACQRFGPLCPSRRQLKTILNVQPMDMLGIDFVGPISPRSTQGSKYILIVVDYFSRYLFAEATTSTNGETVVKFIRHIAQRMGWPLAIYCDNASYFVKGSFPEELNKRKVLLFPAPITHPSSVGLAEKYVHLTMTALRTILQGGIDTENPEIEDMTPPVKSMPLDRWEESLPAAVFAINNRIVKTHGFSPAQLMFGFTPRGHPEDFSLRDEMAVYTGMLEEKQIAWARDRNIEDWEESKVQSEIGDDKWIRLAKLEEQREHAVQRTYDNQQQLEKREIGRGDQPKKGDLVLLRRFIVDKDKGRKLETKWEGPYVVERVGYSGVSVVLHDLLTDKRKGRYSMDSIKLYVRRGDEKNENFIDISTWEPARVGASSLWRRGVNLMETVGDYLLI